MCAAMLLLLLLLLSLATCCMFQLSVPCAASVICIGHHA
jgi:hypothetical protein